MQNARRKKKESLFSIENYESILNTLIIPLYQNDPKKKDELAFYSCLLSIPSLPCWLSFILKKYLKSRKE